jgi:fibronectin-binding autotransporter adhesin
MLPPHRLEFLKKACLVAALSSTTFAGTSAWAANTGNIFNTTATDLSVGSNFVLTIVPLSATTTDLQLAGNYTAGTTFTVGGSALNFGTLNDLNTSQNLVISNASTTAGSLTLNTPANSTAGANAADLLYVASGANLAVQNGAGAIVLKIAATGNIHNDGTLNLAAPLSIAAGQTATFTGAGATTVGGDIAALAGSVAVNTTGGGSVTLSGNNGYIGNTAITSGTLNAANIVVSGGTSNIGNALTAVTLGGAATKGILNYTGNAATYTRGFIVNAGGGEVDSATAGQTLTIGTGGVLTGGGLFTIGGAGNTSITSIIGGGAGGLAKTGAGTLSLSGANTYAGPTTVSGGVVQISAAANLGNASASNTIALNGGTLESTANNYALGATRAITLTGANTIQTDAGTLTANGVLGGTGTLTKTGAGTLTLAGANNLMGGVQVNAGTLALANTTALSANNAVTLGAGGILDLNGTPTQTIASLSGTAGVVTNTSTTPATLTLAGNASASFGGTIADQMCPATVLGLNVALNGGATQTLSGANTYTGLTTVVSGTLQAGNSNAFGNNGIVNTIGTGGTVIDAGGTVDLNGQANVNEVLTLNGTGSGGNGALINSNTAATATIGSGVSSLNVSGNFTGLSANTTVSIGASTSGTNATAAAVLGVTNSSFNIIGGTTIYTVAPTVTIGGGTGATAVANLTAGIVTSITVTNPGCGFTSVPTISFTGGAVLVPGLAPNGVGVDGHFTLDGLQVTNNGSGYTSAPTVSVSSGAVTTTANLTAVALAGNTSVGGSGTITINPVISGAGFNLTKVGSGTVTLSNQETYTGGTVLTGGTLAVGVTNAIASSTSVAISGNANLALGSNNTTVNGDVTLTSGSITGTGTLTASSAGTSYTVVNGSVGASLGGTGASLIKATDGTTAGGTVTLTGVNTYTGPTIVNGGTLEVDGSLAAGSIVTVGGAGGSGTPLLTGSGTINGAVTIASAGAGAAGTINPGGVGTIGTLTVGSITFQTGSTLALDINGGSSDLLNITNAATIAAGANVQITAGNLTLGTYVLATAASGLNGNVLNIIGALPSGYVIVATGTTLDLQHVGDQTFSAPAPGTLNMIVGSTTTVGGTLSNTAPAGSQALTVNLADNGGTGGVVSGLVSSGGATVAPGGSTTVTGNFTAGTVGIGETYSFKNTDTGAVPTTVSVTGLVNVYHHSTPTLTIAAGNNQSVFVNGALASATVTLADLGALPVPLDVNTLTNLTGATGSGVIGSGGTGIYTATGIPTGTAGIGQTATLSLKTGDQQTVTGANPLTTLSQTLTYNVYNHATPTLTPATGNNQSVFVNGALAPITLTLADSGTVPAPLDVNTLTNLTGATGSGVIGSGGTGSYTATGSSTAIAGTAQTLVVSLMAGDQQIIPGANPLSTLSQNITYNVYNHATPTLTIGTGNNQSVFVNGALANATVTLSNAGTFPAPLDVNTLNNLTGATGSGVVGSGGAATYTATGFDTTAAGVGQTLAVSLKAGDQQVIPGANPLATLAQNITYNVYNHATPTLVIATGNNQSVFVNGALSGTTLTLSNTGTIPAPLDVSTLNNLTGATGSGVVGSGGTGTYTATGFNTSTAGAGKTLNTSLLAGDQQTIAGANPLATLNQAVVYNVYNHATSSLTSGILNLGLVHVGYAGPITSSNSLTATNGSVADVRVNLQGSAPTAGNISLNNLTGIASGGSGTISATLAAGQGLGAIDTPLTYTFADQSDIAGALNNVGTAAITVAGQVYSGQGVWAGNGTPNGSWGTLLSGFGLNWGVNQGSPGLDSNFTTTDTAMFGNIAGQASQLVTLDGANPSLNGITFNGSSTSYNLAQGTGGAFTLNGGAGPATITDAATGGTQTISAPVGLATTVDANVSALQTLDLGGSITGTGGITLDGPGKVILSGINSYLGTTNAALGTLVVNGTTLDTGSVLVGAGATLAGIGSTGNVVVSGGGRINLQDGVIGTLTVNSLSIGTAGIPSSISFDIGSGATGNLDKIVDNGALVFNGAGGTVIDVANIGGMPTLSDGLFTLISSTGLTGGLADVSLSQTALDGKMLSLQIVGNSLDLSVADLTSATTYSLSASAANGRIIVGTGSTTVTSTITNTGSADSLTYTGLNVTTTGGTLGAGTLPQNGGPVPANGGTSSGTRLLAAGGTTGVVTITPTVSSASNTTLGGNAILDSTTTTTVDVVANRVVTASAVALGRVLVGQAVSGASTLSTTGDDADFTRVTVGTTGPDVNGISATGGNGAVVFNGATVTDTRTVGGVFTTAGSMAGTLTLITTGEGLAGENPIDVALDYTADPVTQRVITNGAVTQLGELHTGATISVTSNPFTTAGTHDTTTDVIVAAGGGVADANGIELTGGPTTFNGNVASDTRTLSGTIVNATGGVTSGTFNLGVTTLENGGLGLAGEGAYAPVAVSYSAMVYSGQGVYNAPGSGSWGTAQMPVNWTANGGAPGLDPDFLDTDSATFANSIGNTMATVTLDGDNPSLNAITFANTQGGSYTIAPGTGGIITLDDGAGTAAITNAGENNAITTAITLASNSLFSSAAGTTLTLDGPIGQTDDEPRSIIVNGPGTVVFGGDNTYSGGTTLTSGILDLTGAGTLGAPAGALAIAGGTLDLGGTTQTVGPVSITGTGTIQNGTLDGSSYADSAPSGTTIIGATLGGAGGLAMTGGGLLELNGPNTYSGATTISSGMITVGNPAGLGTGNVTLSGGALATGNGNDLIHVTGNYAQSGGTLVLGVAGLTPGVAGGYDALHVAGTAALGGALQVVIAPSFTPMGGDTFVFVQAGTITGDFTSVAANLGSLSLTQVVPGTYTIEQLPFATLPGVTYTPNQMAVATDVDNGNQNGGTSSAPYHTLVGALNGLTAAGESPDALSNAFDQLTIDKFSEFVRKTIFNNATFSTQLLDNYFENQRSWQGDFLRHQDSIDSSRLTVLDPSMDPALAQVGSRLLAWNPSPLPHGMLSDTSDLSMAGVDMAVPPPANASEKERAFNIFVMGNVVLAQSFSQADLTHADTTTGGVQIGLDYLLTPHFKVGVMFGYGHTDGTLDNIGSKATLDSYAPGIYASFADKGWYANALGSYGFNSLTENRSVSFGTLSGTGTGAPSGNQIIGDLDGGYDFHEKNWTFGPSAGVQYTHFEVDGFTEDGSAPIDLNVGRENSDSLRSRLGGHVSCALRVGKMTLTPHLDASWQHEFLDQSRGITSQFTSLGAGSFTIDTIDPSRDSALVDAGVSADLNGQVSVYLDYVAQAGQSDYFGQSVQAGIKIGF